MNFFCDSKGVIFHVDGEPVYQNSAGANVVYFIGAFPTNSQVTVAYKLPNGIYTDPQLMTRVIDGELNDIKDKYGKGFSIWKATLGESVNVDAEGNIIYGQDFTITENAGRVDIQFYVYGNSPRPVLLATAGSNFELGKGVPIVLPDGIENNILAQILASLQGILDSVDSVKELPTQVTENKTSIENLGERVTANKEEIIKNRNTISVLKEVQYQSGLQYIQPLESAYNERTTANGENVLDFENNGSTARILKVNGNTQSSAEYVGLKNVKFQGIISKNADGNKESALSLPYKMDIGLGTTIDFEQQRVVNYGVDITLTGDEAWSFYSYKGTYGVFSIMLPTAESRAYGVSTDGIVVDEASLPTVKDWANVIWAGAGEQNVLYWLGILDILGFTANWVDKASPTDHEKTQAILDFKNYLRQRHADENPVKIRYISSTLQSDIPFPPEMKAIGNEYKVWRDGTEQVQSNDNAEYGIFPKITQEYVVVAEIGETSQTDYITEALKGEY